MPSPDFHVVDLHGNASDLLVAVGTIGRISRWDGSKWTALDSGTRTNLSSVFVASDTEMYASGHGGALLQGSVYGWVVLEGETQLP
ncbi:MAG: hypothetical protein HN348_06725 [Proteobacteria bacterium]|nr:hypothetical protein [Pseudomonadota bacterium]